MRRRPEGVTRGHQPRHERSVPAQPGWSGPRWPAAVQGSALPTPVPQYRTPQPHPLQVPRGWPECPHPLTLGPAIRPDSTNRTQGDVTCCVLGLPRWPRRSHANWAWPALPWEINGCSCHQPHHDRNLTGPTQRGLLGSRAQQENPATGSGGGGQSPRDPKTMSWSLGLGWGLCAPVRGGGTSPPRQASRWAGCRRAGLWDRTGTCDLAWSGPQRAERGPH